MRAIDDLFHDNRPAIQCTGNFKSVVLKSRRESAHARTFGGDFELKILRMRRFSSRFWTMDLKSPVYIVVVSLDFFLEPIFYLPKYSLSEVYFNTDRLLIEFNGLSYSLAARQVFVAIANPDSLSFG